MFVWEPPPGADPRVAVLVEHQMGWLLRLFTHFYCVALDAEEDPCPCGPYPDGCNWPGAPIACMHHRGCPIREEAIANPPAGCCEK